MAWSCKNTKTLYSFPCFLFQFLDAHDDRSPSFQGLLSNPRGPSLCPLHPAAPRTPPQPRAALGASAPGAAPWRRPPPQGRCYGDGAILGAAREAGSGAERSGGAMDDFQAGDEVTAPGGWLRPRCGVPGGWRGVERLQAPALPVAVAQAETKPGPCRAGGAAAAGGTSPRCGGR